MALSWPDVEDGLRPRITKAETEEMREMKKRNRSARARERGASPSDCLPRLRPEPKRSSTGTTRSAFAGRSATFRPPNTKRSGGARTRNLCSQDSQDQNRGRCMKPGALIVQ